MTISRFADDVPVIDRHDVVVVGGGIAGVAAALAAARQGMRVCLVEKSCGLGGLATLGNVAVYLPICDGLGHQVIGGLGEELLRLSVADGFNPLPAAWARPASEEERAGQRFRVTFNPPSYMLALEALLVHQGVDIWYDTVLCDAMTSGQRITSAIVQNKSGRTALEAGAFIDCTGDADLCHYAGEKTVSLDTNVRSAWFYYHAGDEVHLVVQSDPFTEDGSPQKGVERGYAGDSGKDVSAQIIGSRDLIRERWAEIRREHPDARLVNVPTMPTFRMTRRLAGAATLTEADAGHVPDDMVGLCPSWRKAGIVYGVPYSTLVGHQIANLLAAGRCMSAAGRLWDMMRVIPLCALTGEIAGIAASQAVQADQDLRALSIAHLQHELVARGNILNGELIVGR